MASTYVNNLRLEEIGTGEQSGTWGDTTNTNLEIIGQAVAWGTRAIANASTDNITIADGALDADRCLGLKLTGGGQACAVTLLPLTSSKTWFIHNTTNSTLTFRAGSDTTSEQVAILAGETKVIATDGLGADSIVYDLLTAVNLAGVTKVDDLIVGDDLVVADDASVGGTLGVTGVLTATSLDISGDIDVDGTTNLDIVDIDGAVNMATTALVTGVLTTTAATVHTNGITMPDGAIAKFGTDDDLQISHINGTGSLIRQGGEGNLFIQGSDSIVFGAGDGSETLATFTDDGGCTLNFNNAAKIATKATGVTVTGEMAATTMDLSSNAVIDGTALVTGVLTTTATTVFNGGFTSNGNSTVDGTFSTATGLVHLGDTNTSHDFGTDTQAFYTGGVRSLDFGTGETVFNEDGANIDFRVESDTDADTFVLDAGTGVVRIIGKSGASGSVITQHTLAIEEGGFNNGSQLIVVDSAGGKRFDCDGNGVVMVGEYSAQTVAAQIPRFQVGSNGDVESTMLAWRRSNDVKGPSFHFAKSRNTGGAAFTVVNGGDSLGQIKFFADDGANMDHSAAEIQVIASSTASGPSSNDVPGIMIFKTTVDNGIAPTEAMRIDSAQNLLIGCTVSNYPAVHGTTFSGDAITVSRSGGVTFDFNRSNTGTLGIFRQNTTDVGSIDVDGNSTTYSTSSDYRLKENVDYSWDATTRLKQLKPARFNFISDDTNTLVDGFLAHEAQAVVPKAVTGTHNEVDDAGNAVMQGIDQSKLVPLLVKTIQELEARITALEG